MGVVNVTPDSFSGDGILNPEQAIVHAEHQIKRGANILDIGGESSRPGAQPLTVEEELARIEPIVQYLAEHTITPLSIDTYKPEVADTMLRLGAHIVNDIHGGRSNELLETVAKHQAGYILMHMQGDPTTMQNKPTYDNIIEELIAFFEERLAKAQSCGISNEQIMLDPGIGFGKTVEHNLTILRELPKLIQALPYPFLIGTSRKSFIGKLTRQEDPTQRVWGTAASVAIAIYNGAAAVRVHDVTEMTQVAQIADAIKQSSLQNPQILV